MKSKTLDIAKTWYSRGTEHIYIWTTTEALNITYILQRIELTYAFVSISNRILSHIIKEEVFLILYGLIYTNNCHYYRNLRENNSQDFKKDFKIRRLVLAGHISRYMLFIS